MVVSAARVVLHVRFAQSLKDKRAVVRKIKDRVAARLSIQIAEVGGQDTWQTAVLGFSVCSGEMTFAEEKIDEVMREVAKIADMAGEVQIVDSAHETFRLGPKEVNA